MEKRKTYEFRLGTESTIRTRRYRAGNNIPGVPPPNPNSSRSTLSTDTTRSSIQLRYPHEGDNLAAPMRGDWVSSNASMCNLPIVFYQV